MSKGAARVILVSSVLAGVLLLCVGILQDQDSNVLNKAIRICLECIGIG